MWLSNAVKIAASVIAMQMRWYNPSLRDFEWRSAPDSDEEALAILKDSSRSQLCVEVYWEWRNLERVMNLGKSRIEMRISRSAWFPRDLCFLHS
jgi:hypothetical protein